MSTNCWWVLRTW